MTITEIYNTAERLKEDVEYINKMIDEVASRLYNENNTPTRWTERLQEMQKELRNFHKDVDAWKVEKMTKKLVEAMANGQLTEEDMLEYDKKE